MLSALTIRRKLEIWLKKEHKMREKIFNQEELEKIITWEDGIRNSTWEYLEKMHSQGNWSMIRPILVVDRFWLKERRYKVYNGHNRLRFAKGNNLDLRANIIVQFALFLARRLSFTFLFLRRIDCYRSIYLTDTIIQVCIAHRHMS